MAGNFKLSDDYIEVAERIALFKAAYPDGTLQPLDYLNPYITQEIGGETLIVYAAAAYRTPDDLRPGVGVASEPFPGRTPYTKGSEIANAETSAWGRAIVALGIPSKHVATKEDVRNRSAERGDSEGPPAAQSKPKGTINEVQVRALKELRPEFSDAEWLEALTQFAAKSVMDLSHDDAELMIIALQAAKDARVAPAAAEAAPVAAEAAAAPPAATEPPQTAEAQDSAETAGLDGDDKAFLKGCDDDNRAAQAANEPEKGGGTIAAKQLQRLGIICSHLERAGIMWQPIATGVIKRAFESRKEFSFEEGRAVILTLREIEKTLPEDVKAS